MAINACTTDKPKSATVETITYSKVETIISSDESILGKPGNLVDIQGDRMYLLDYSQLKILEISAAGELLNSFSRQGKGPGELTMASNILTGNEKILIHNTDRSSLSRFSPDGKYLDTQPINVPVSLSANISIFNDRMLMSAIDKNDGIVTLASLKNLKNNIIALGDTTIGNVPTAVNFDEYNSAISNDEIPTIFKDDVLTLFDDQGNAYLVYQGQTRVQKYNLSGELIWDNEITFSEKDKVFKKFIEANTSNTFNRIIPLKYFSEAKHYKDELFLLISLENEEDSFILTLKDESGKINKRIEFPNLNFAPTGFVYQSDIDAFFFVNRRGSSLVKVTNGNK
jgi:hypothetical protein